MSVVILLIFLQVLKIFDSINFQDLPIPENYKLKIYYYEEN